MAEVRAGSLRSRLLWRLAALLAIPLLLGSLSAYWNGRVAADSAYDRTLLASARAIADGLYTDDGRLRADVPYVALDPFAYDLEGRIFYQVSDLDGHLVSGYDGLPAPPEGTPRTDAYPALARFYNGEFDHVGVRLVSLLQPVSEPGMDGMAEIRVAETVGARERMARSLLLDTLWRMGLLALASLVLVWLAVTAALRPLETLRKVVATRASDDLQPLPDAGLPREVRPLVSALNQFNERLRDLFERQSQFIADAAHELRTPLAALKARVELGLRAESPQVWRDTLERTDQQTDRVTHLANQLLSLARIESGARAIAEGSAERLNLSQLVRDLGMALAPLAHKRGVVLELEAPEPVWLRGDPTLLHELVYNLVANAMTHSPQDGRVVLRVMAPAVLEVEDDGPGIAEAERERVFQRFYRSQPQSTGAGLGLAIVGEVCRAHHARIELLDGEPSGLRVRVEFVGVEAG